MPLEFQKMHANGDDFVIVDMRGTAGYPQGVVQGRWTGCTTQPIPSVKKVALAELRDALPRDTPRLTLPERQAQIRERRLALQQRPLW